jgi:ABC-type Fe3+-hydroxamate transport system substrate-binding protein
MGRFRSGVAVVVGVVLVAGCGTGTEGGTGSIVVDSCGREVVFDSPPERVLAIGSEALASISPRCRVGLRAMKRSLNSRSPNSSPSENLISGPSC